MALSHRAKFQLIINFFRVKVVSTGLLEHHHKLVIKKSFFWSAGFCFDF